MNIASLAIDVDFHPSGRYVATGNLNGKVRVWDDLKRRTIAVFEGHSGPVFRVAFAPSGASVASAGEDGTVRLWKQGQAEPIIEFLGHTGPVNAVDFSPTGSLVASADREDKRVFLWDPGNRLTRILTAAS